MFRFLGLILVGFVCFYLVLNLGFFCVWMNMFVGLCFCVREKIMRSEERKKEKEEKKKKKRTQKPNEKEWKKKMQPNPETQCEKKKK